MIDGAVFLIAQGANPEATLFWEAVKRIDGAKPIWQYAVGQTLLAENVVFYEDQEIHHGRRVAPGQAILTTASFWRSLTKIEAPNDGGTKGMAERTGGKK